MADGNLPDIETLRKLLAYDPATGDLTWQPRPASMFEDGAYSADRSAAAWNARYAGHPALAMVGNRGYLTGAIFNRKHLAHRVAWAVFHGEWPADQIDHINGDKADNRIDNLRSVTNAENGRNAKRSSNNSSGVTGVFWNAWARKWQAQIMVNGYKKHLGYFTDFDAAAFARKAADAEHGFHFNHGRPS